MIHKVTIKKRNFGVILQETGIPDKYFHIQNWLDFDINPNKWTPEEDSEESKVMFTKRAFPFILTIFFISNICVVSIFFMEKFLTFSKMKNSWEHFKIVLKRGKEFTIAQVREDYYSHKISCCCCIWILIASLLSGLIFAALMLILSGDTMDNNIKFSERGFSYLNH